MIWWTALLFGLFGSVHCIGMCGPIALGIPYYGRSYSGAVGRLLLYQAGRSLTYGLLGAVLGSLSFGINFFGWQQWLSIGIGVILLLSLLFSHQPENMLIKWKPLERLYAISRQWLSAWMQSKKPGRYLMIGLLNGLLPCGLVYMALAGALTTGSAEQGAFYMILFGLGTIPAMLSVSLIGHNLKQSHRVRLQKLMPFIILLFAVLFILRGLNLDIRFISPANPAYQSASEQCD